MQQRMFSSGLYLHTLERLVTEQRQLASVDTDTAYHEYDSKRRTVAFFIESSSQIGEKRRFQIFKRYSAFKCIEVSHSFHSRGWSARCQVGSKWGEPK